MLLQRQSGLKASQGIAAEHAAKARKAAGQAQLDLRIFHESYEPPKRGFLRRPTPQEREQLRRCERVGESGLRDEPGSGAENAFGVRMKNFKGHSLLYRQAAFTRILSRPD